ncbi:DUF885 domain-containing protein [Wenzhouxiangella sp. XN79A]|nr:DUF885 domain-containing protein [Wenzhouxiangella sp. XN79A]NKI34877.1 DUF885 domain-containing protein [Wenzhouxiangella sp. XN79A]
MPGQALACKVGMMKILERIIGEWIAETRASGV